MNDSGTGTSNDPPTKRSPDVNLFQNARDFSINRLQVSTSAFDRDPLKELRTHIAAGAIHDSKERRNEPKCYEGTRVAVQDMLYGWITSGEVDLKYPRKMKWVTGPAGTGKTAVLGSLAERCKAGKKLAATFFFGSWPASIRRRRNGALVATIAHQLALNYPDVSDKICKAIEANPDIFDKDLPTQMATLVSAPLREIAAGQPKDRPPVVRGVIIIDGLDECEAEQIHDHDSTNRESRAKPAPRRTKEEDQEEILKVLKEASSDQAFPFRILIACRPERVFDKFFNNPAGDSASFAEKLDLNEEYHASNDIRRYLEEELRRIRERSPTFEWRPEDIETLVNNASGQFIYAATIIRFLDVEHQEPRQAVLNTILGMKTTSTLNPFEQLDALYLHILELHPEAKLSIRWIRGISQLASYTSGDRDRPAAFHVNLFLRGSRGSEVSVEFLLGSFHSLIRIPPLDDTVTPYDFYHISLLDFLNNRSRCQKLYVDASELSGFIWEAFIRVCEDGSTMPTGTSYPECFLQFLFDLEIVQDYSAGGLLISWVTKGIACPTLHPPPRAAVNWWVSTAIERRVDGKLKGSNCLMDMFRAVHQLWLVPIVALFEGRIVDKPESDMPVTEYSTGGFVEHEIIMIGGALFLVIEMKIELPKDDNLAQLFLELLSAAELNKQTGFAELRVFGLLTDLSTFRFYSFDPVTENFNPDEDILVNVRRDDFCSGMIQVANKVFSVIMCAYVKGLQATVDSSKKKSADAGDVRGFFSLPPFSRQILNPELSPELAHRYPFGKRPLLRPS
ncbi:hypothetical protein H1R20_g12289, partial [Candolleomyces eurysporus]